MFSGLHFFSTGALVSVSYFKRYECDCMCGGEGGNGGGGGGGVRVFGNCQQSFLILCYWIPKWKMIKCVPWGLSVYGTFTLYYHDITGIRAICTLVTILPEPESELFVHWELFYLNQNPSYLYIGNSFTWTRIWAFCTLVKLWCQGWDCNQPSGVESLSLLIATNVI